MKDIYNYFKRKSENRKKIKELENKLTKLRERRNVF